MTRAKPVKCPQPYPNWAAYWYDLIDTGMPIESLVGRGYSAAHIRDAARNWALRNHLPLPTALEYIRPQKAGRAG